MSGLIYYTDKRSVLPQLERTKTYIDTQNISEEVKLLRKTGFMSPKINLIDENIDNKLIEWKKSKNYNLAGDILSQALLAHRDDGIEIIKKHLLSKYPTDSIYKWLFDKKDLHFTIKEKIEYNYRKLKIEPKDSIGWTDQAINFILQNNREESIKCIEEALNINSDLGFIVRNASRLFHLIGDTGRSIKVLKSSEYYNHDPQILSAEISFSQLANRRTNGIEIGQKLIDDKRYMYNEKTELASSLGTIEFQNGEFKKSEKLFAISLLAPNNNSLAQYIWYKKGSLPILNFSNFENSNEILTHLSLKENDFEKSLEYSLNWKEEEPYSLRPYMVASQLTGEILGHYNEAFKIILQGTEAQKLIKADNFSEKEELALSNDMAYYLLKDEKIEEAEEYIKPLLLNQNKPLGKNSTDYIFVATIGLLAYKQMNYDLGRRLYRTSIKFFQDLNLPYLAGSAFLNFFDEELKLVTNLESLLALKKELDDVVPINAQNDLLYRKSKSIKSFQNVLRKLTNH
jgi:hypothetical protein